MSDSLQDKLNRVRKPRVHITYDVETGGAEVKKELPFVVGVMGDYSGDNTDAKKSLKERKFVNIDRDNFNEIMEKVAPTLDLKVQDEISGDPDKQVGMSLAFNSIEDFEPQNIVKQIPALKELLEARNRLRDLLSKADRSEELEGLLEQVLSDADKMAVLSKEVEERSPAKDEDGGDA
ncbi:MULTISPECIES: type VI secretion system contractile sheath small subunit [unclassified Hahella]|uniref:type VI secretion system contractile sheath small subunit n=1 Tax=unclassified Hahella TaxID=2624107 RepID=UPI001C1EBAE3|nr:MULTISPECIES: type VI secretion system contractile sheath small subunit [unclassified Hahella]MBU6954829.1 type VI secretion system contractile sheath small subunit [Hahella sp. HN01]MDG9668009.1 type VI secretion system contractile sheath small subunit [Hahella sp. CR1]WLQ17111.1 type VI secretion system contractile sheath small subunit [Hahella sp. HNIBRBA332]